MQKVVITTAQPLDAAAQKTIKELLAKRFGKDLEYKTVIDASLVAGAKILVGTQEIDVSVAHKLEIIKGELLTQD